MWVAMPASLRSSSTPAARVTPAPAANTIAARAVVTPRSLAGVRWPSSSARGDVPGHRAADQPRAQGRPPVPRCGRCSPARTQPATSPVTFGVLSYAGTLQIIVLSDPSRVPDVAVLTAALHRELGNAAR